MSEPATQVDSAILAGEQNPFLRYRERLDSYAAVREGRISDGEFVDLVSEIDASIAAVWGRGFLVSPLLDGTALATASNVQARLSIKVESNGVGGSHKSRHLMGFAIDKLIAERLGGPAADNFAIASCDLPGSFVEAVTDVVMSDNARMMNIHNAAASTLPENWDKNEVLMWHPGAAKWFRDNAGADIPDDMIHGM